MDKDIANAVLVMAYDYAFKWAMVAFVSATFLGWIQSLCLWFMIKQIDKRDEEDDDAC